MNLVLWIFGALVAESAALIAALTVSLPVAVVAHVVAALAAGQGERHSVEARWFTFALVLTLPALGLAGLVATRLVVRMAGPLDAYETVHAALSELPDPARPPQSVDRIGA